MNDYLSNHCSVKTSGLVEWSVDGLGYVRIWISRAVRRSARFLNVGFGNWSIDLLTWRILASTVSPQFATVLEQDPCPPIFVWDSSNLPWAVNTVSLQRHKSLIEFLNDRMPDKFDNKILNLDRSGLERIFLMNDEDLSYLGTNKIAAYVFGAILFCQRGETLSEFENRVGGGLVAGAQVQAEKFGASIGDVRAAIYEHR